MTWPVEIRDDPDHAEGGHALIVFEGARGPAGPATLLIQPLTEGFVYAGPRHVDAVGEATERGLLFAVGGGVLDRLEPGIAVALSVQGSGIAAELLWPELTPLRLTTRRTGMRAGVRRVVATDSGPPSRGKPPVLGTPDRPPIRPSDGAYKAPVRNGNATATTETAAGRTDKAEAQTDAVTLRPDPVIVRIPPVETVTPITLPADLLKADRPGRSLDSVPGGTLPDTVPGSDAAGEAPPTPDPNRTADRLAGDADRSTGPVPAAGWRGSAVAALTVLAFCLGAGATGAVWFTRPAPAPVTKTVTVTPSLPSPYDLLHTLSDRSPLGVPVDMADAGGFLKRSRIAGSESESRFWRQWATRAMLETRANGAAATLSDFATDLARAHADQPTLAAARFLWEMAALADDCAASDNIGRALGIDGNPESADKTTWQKRARDCRAKANSGPH